MNLQDLKDIRPTRITNGRPSSTLTDREWQKQFALMKLYITPHDKSVRCLKGKYTKESGKHIEDKMYYGITNWQSYCSYINDVLRNIRAGERDWCYFGYQIVDLLKFHFDDLKTKYCDGYWEVWLEG